MRFFARFRDWQTGDWSSVEAPRALLIAHQHDEVPEVLREVERVTRAGAFAVGFVSYEAASAFDRRLAHHDPGSLPLALFAISDVPVPCQPPTGSALMSFEPTISEARFAQQIGAVHDYLIAGDTYQVNYTHRLRGQLRGSTSGAFASLCRAQPSPFAMHLEFGNHAILSVSPELFFERTGETIRCEPMKGTIARGDCDDSDGARRAALAGSGKDQAENLMIVDMVRNDLSRISEPGSVDVPSLFELRDYPTVWQQVSSITARSPAPLDHIFAALFPCASITGAPRHRTMEIIRELEPTPRGIYTGAIGVVHPGGNARFSVAIRTLSVDLVTGAAEYGVGGGIVHESTAEAEWLECRSKAAVLEADVPRFELLETLRYQPGEGIWLLERHLARLQHSATELGFALDLAQVRARLNAACGNEALRLRLLVGKDGTLRLENFPLGDRGNEPVRLRLAREPVSADDLFLRHKTTHRAVYEAARNSVADCDDVILCNTNGELTETTICNLFLDIDGVLLTPRKEAGLLPGTLRQQMLETGEAREAILTLEDLARADRVLVGNSVRGLMNAVWLQDN